MDRRQSINNEIIVNFDIQNLDDWKWFNLGLGAHLRSSILTQVQEQYWFSSYLFDNLSSLDKSNNIARLSVCLRSDEILTEILQSNVDNLISTVIKKEKFKNATHVIETIHHGFNIIVVFEKPVSSPTEKIEVEEQLILQARDVFHQLVSLQKSNYTIGCDTSVIESATRKCNTQFVCNKNLYSFTVRLY